MVHFSRPLLVHFLATLDISASDVQKIADKILKVSNFTLDPMKEIAQGIVVPQEYVINASQKVLGDNFRVGDGIFTLSTSELKALSLTKNELQLLKPFYTTRELGRWWADHKNNRWIIYTDSSFKDKRKIGKYPNIKKHLDKFRKVITSDKRLSDKVCKPSK